MKRVIIATLFWIIALWSWFQVFAGSGLSNIMEKRLDIIVEKIDSNISILSFNQKQEQYMALVKVLERMRSRVSSENKPIMIYLENSFRAKMIAMPLIYVEDIKLNKDIYTLPNVNMDTLRESRLSRHNQARANLWKPAFTRNTKLEKTAYNRATHFVKIGTRTHKRKSTDGFYNYNSIKNWFANQWVCFDESKWTAFSENIAFEFTNCDKSDCTQEVLGVMKKWFDFFMSEASRNWSHYRAIIHPNFTEIWLWIWKDWNKYYLVTHYAVKVK